MAFGHYDPTANFFKLPSETKKAKKPFRQRKSIPKVSPKRKIANLEYEKSKRRWRHEREQIDEFRCEVVRENGARCKRKASKNPHHRKGRTGKLLHDVDYFLAACNACHAHIHANPAWAYRAGYMIKRI